MCTICQTFRPADPDCPYGATAPAVEAARTEAGDAAAGTGTTARMAPGDSFTGTIGRSGDHDWIAVDLAAGQTYRIQMNGLSLPDPYLYLRDGGGRLITANDDSNGLDSQITFTATQGGRYYIDAAAYSSHTGSYRVEVETVRPPEPASMTEMARYLTHGFWEDLGLTSRAFDGNVISVDLTGLTVAGRQLARHALDAWSAVADLRFVERARDADITFGDDQSGAYATSSVTGGRIISSHINVSTEWLSHFGTQIGGYGFQTYIHEIGHALGLGHQGGYNGSAEFGWDETFTNDSWQASVMSYFTQDDNPNVTADFAYLVSLMPADILAIRELYGAAGADGLTAGNTVYGRGHSLGDSWLGLVFDAQIGGGDVLNARRVAVTIADSDGWDRLDLGHDGRDQRIDMRAGAVSDVFGLRGNLQIAHDTRIEALQAGRGDDLVIGNDGRNNIRGGAGDDRIMGDRGNDTLRGDAGNDLLRSLSGNNRMEGGEGRDTLEAGGGSDLLTGGSGNDLLRGGTGADTLVGNLHRDRLEGQGGSDILWGGFGDDVAIGGDGNDRLHGQQGLDRLMGGNGNDRMTGNEGADSLFGGAGADTLDGGWGADALWGGTGHDVFRFARGGHSAPGSADVIHDFGRGNDRIDLGDTGLSRYDQLSIARQGGETRIAADLDGDGRTDLLIRLAGSHALEADDFIF